jgi:hypothetical protein
MLKIFKKFLFKECFFVFGEWKYGMLGNIPFVEMNDFSNLIN